MRVWIGLATANGELRAFFGRQKAVAPADSLKEQKFGGHRISVVAASYVPKPAGPSVNDFECFVMSSIRDSDAAILLIDENWIHLAQNLRASCLVLPLRPIPDKAAFQNFVQKTTSLALRIWWQVWSRFSNARDIQLLSLPLRNFQAAELIELANAVRINSHSPAVGFFIDQALKNLRLRVRPRRRSSFQNLYVVDDMTRFFSYGHEKHSKPETGGEHHSYCQINASFRFGCRIENDRHFNVSETEGDRTSVSGNFRNCHEVESYETRDTHLNMFPNDMYY